MKVNDSKERDKCYASYYRHGTEGNTGSSRIGSMIKMRHGIICGIWPILLGHIGNETECLISFSRFCSMKTTGFRLEALKSIYQIGGKQRGLLLLSVLPKADDQFKLNIIETLGNAKCAEAVPNLLDLLKKPSLMASQLQIDLQEKICVALELIGSPEAIPALSEIAESKSLLRLRAYPEKVKYAAGSALESIRRKQKQAANAES
ncbi:MAG: HEAT repeat domain-containing protein [Desulfobacterales bacterium]|nr:HEAT repeat domain-containing protein [Desulfobacterales bacterium]